MDNNEKPKSNSHDLPPLKKDRKETLVVKLEAYLLVEKAIQDDKKFTSSAKMARLLDIRNKITAIRHELKAFKKITLDRDTKEPSSTSSDKMLSYVEKILNAYRDQLHNRPEAAPELPIQYVVYRALETGISSEPELEELGEGEKFTMPETIGGMPIEQFIAAIQKINDDERTARAEAQGKGFDDDDLVAEALAQQQSMESSELPSAVSPQKPAKGDSSRSFKHRLHDQNDETPPEEQILPKLK